MHLEIATKQEVIEWFDSHPGYFEMYLQFECENFGHDSVQDSFEEVVENTVFRFHPTVGLIPDFIDDLENEVWGEVVFSEVYYVSIHKFLWFCQVRRDGEDDPMGSGLSDTDKEQFFQSKDLEELVKGVEREVREYKRHAENVSVHWETRSWSNGKKFVYLSEIEDFVEVEASGEFGEIASVELSDIFESTAQVVQSADGKLYVKVTLLDEYLMEIESVNEAQIILKDFEHLWGRLVEGEELPWD